MYVKQIIARLLPTERFRDTVNLFWLQARYWFRQQTHMSFWHQYRCISIQAGQAVRHQPKAVPSAYLPMHMYPRTHGVPLFKHVTRLLAIH